MKKIIATLLALSMIMTMCIPAFATSKMFGDVNDDGKITAVDARVILQVVAGSKEETEFIKSNGDLNSDGKISAVDARIILQVVAGIKELPENNKERADERLKNYIIKNGYLIEDGEYGLVEEVYGIDTFMYYNSNDDEFTFACDIVLEDGKTTVAYMQYNYGEETQEVITSSTVPSSSEKLITKGYIYTASFTEENEDVYLTYHNFTSKDSAIGVTAAATSILLMQTEEMLKETGTGVTLHELGFVSW